MKMSIEKLNEIQAQYEPIVRARNLVGEFADELAQHSQYR